MVLTLHRDNRTSIRFKLIHGLAVCAHDYRENSASRRYTQPACESTTDPKECNGNGKISVSSCSATSCCVRVFISTYCMWELYSLNCIRHPHHCI